MIFEPKEFYYKEGRLWDFTIDFTSWVIGIEWSKHTKWVELKLLCFSLTIWWEKDKFR